MTHANVRNTASFVLAMLACTAIAPVARAETTNAPPRAASADPSGGSPAPVDPSAPSPQPPEPTRSGELTKAEKVGRGLTVGGILIAGVGLLVTSVAVAKGAEGGSGMMDGLENDFIAMGGGITASTGLVMILVGAPLWAKGSQPPPLEVSVGGGTVDLRGTF